MRATQELHPDYKTRISLMEAIGFTSDDIMANRQGQLSKHQQSLLREDQAFWQLMSWIVIGGTLLVIGLAIWDGIRVHDTLTSRIELAVLTLVMGGVLYIEAYHRSKQAQRDLTVGRVSTYTGVIRPDSQRDYEHGRIDYRLALGGIKLKVERRVFETFQAGRTYRIYHTPLTKRLLSAEPLDGSGGTQRGKGKFHR